MVPVELNGFPGGGTQNCECVYKQDLLANVRRVWKVLLHAESVESPLLRRTKDNLWITATDADLRRHLRYVAFRMGPRWDARVVADATLITAWLSTAKNVKDPDVLVERMKGLPSDEFLTLVDIAVPFDLLIIRLGVKAAKNREMPGVLAEAISERMHEDKPTWIVDSPVKPLKAGHVCWDDRVEELLWDWDRLELSAPMQDEPVRPPPGGGFFQPSMASQAQTEAAAGEADFPDHAEDVAAPVGHKNLLAGMALTKEDAAKKKTADKMKKARDKKRGGST